MQRRTTLSRINSHHLSTWSSLYGWDCSKITTVGVLLLLLQISNCFCIFSRFLSLFIANTFAQKTKEAILFLSLSPGVWPYFWLCLSGNTDIHMYLWSLHVCTVSMYCGHLDQFLFNYFSSLVCCNVVIPSRIPYAVFFGLCSGC